MEETQDLTEFSEGLRETNKRFGSESEEFAEALGKLSPEILRLLESQFSAEPNSLLKNYFKPAEESAKGFSGETIEDEEEMRELEED